MRPIRGLTAPARRIRRPGRCSGPPALVQTGAGGFAFAGRRDLRKQGATARRPWRAAARPADASSAVPSRERRPPTGLRHLFLPSPLGGEGPGVRGERPRTSDRPPSPQPLSPEGRGEKGKSSMAVKNAHCSWCGAAFAAEQPWPRTCLVCTSVSYLNPAPVVALLLPVDDGVLCVRRGIPPAVGQLALPGGFLDVHESWQQGAARELFEETGLRVDAAEVELFDVLS